MPLKLIRWILYLLPHIEFTASQNITVLVYFGSGTDLASVVAADPTAATYLATYTNMCRSGPCSLLTIYTNIMVQGLSTAARTNIGGGNSQTFACVVTPSLTTGTCTYVGTYRGTAQTFISPMETSYFQWSALTVTAGLDKLSYTVATTNGAASASATTTSATPASATHASAPSASAPSTSIPSASTPSTSDTMSNSGVTSTVVAGSTAPKGAAVGCQTGYLSYAIAGLAGVVIAAL